MPLFFSHFSFTFPVCVASRCFNTTRLSSIINIHPAVMPSPNHSFSSNIPSCRLHEIQQSNNKSPMLSRFLAIIPKKHGCCNAPTMQCSTRQCKQSALRCLQCMFMHSNANTLSVNAHSSLQCLKCTAGHKLSLECNHQHFSVMVSPQ